MRKITFFNTILFAIPISAFLFLFVTPLHADEPKCPAGLAPNWLFLPDEIKEKNKLSTGACQMVSENEYETVKTTGCSYTDTYICVGPGYYGGKNPGLVSRTSCSPCPGGTNPSDIRRECKEGRSEIAGQCGFRCQTGEFERDKSRCSPAVLCPDGSFAPYDIARCYQICSDRSIASGTNRCLQCPNSAITTSNKVNCPNVCGDGLTRGTEVCDEGPANGDPTKAKQRPSQPTKEYCSRSCTEWVPTCGSGEELEEQCTVGQVPGSFAIAASQKSTCTKRCVRKTLLEHLLINAPADQCSIDTIECATSREVLDSVGVPGLSRWAALQRTCDVRPWQSLSSTNGNKAQCGVDLCMYDDKRKRAQVERDQTIDRSQRCGEKIPNYLGGVKCEPDKVLSYYIHPLVLFTGAKTDLFDSAAWKAGTSTFQGLTRAYSDVYFKKIRESVETKSGNSYSSTFECAPSRRGGCAPALQCEEKPTVDVGMYIDGQKVDKLYLSDLLYRMAQLRVAPLKEYADYDREVVKTPEEHEKEKEITRFYIELSVKSTKFLGRRNPVTSGPVAFYLYDDGGKNCLVLQDQTADDNVFSAQVGIVGDKNDQSNPIPENFSLVCEGEKEFVRWAKYRNIITENEPTGEELAAKIGMYLGNTLRVKVYRKKGEPVGAPPLALFEIPIEGGKLTRPNVSPLISMEAIQAYGLNYIKTISLLYGPERLGPDRMSVPTLILDHLKDRAYDWLFTPEQTYEEPTRIPTMPPAPLLPHRSSNAVEQYVLDNGLFPRGACDLGSAANAGRCTAAFEEMKRESDSQYSSPPKVMVGEIGGVTNASGAVVIKKMPNGSIYVLTAAGYKPEELKARVNEFCQRNQCGAPWP